MNVCKLIFALSTVSVLSLVDARVPPSRTFELPSDVSEMTSVAHTDVIPNAKDVLHVDDFRRSLPSPVLDDKTSSQIINASSALRLSPSAGSVYHKSVVRNTDNDITSETTSESSAAEHMESTHKGDLHVINRTDSNELLPGPAARGDGKSREVHVRDIRRQMRRLRSRCSRVLHTVRSRIMTRTAVLRRFRLLEEAASRTSTAVAHLHKSYERARSVVDSLLRQQQKTQSSVRALRSEVAQAKAGKATVRKRLEVVSDSLMRARMRLSDAIADYHAHHSALFRSKVEAHLAVLSYWRQLYLESRHDYLRRTSRYNIALRHSRKQLAATLLQFKAIRFQLDSALRSEAQLERLLNQLDKRLGMIEAHLEQKE